MQKGSRSGQGKEKHQKAALEAGFTNYFSGANHERAIQKDKELRERSKSRNMGKKTDEKPKRGWHDRAMPDYDHNPRFETRTSTDRYSQHSEDEEIDPHNKVDSHRSPVGTKESGQKQNTGSASAAKEDTQYETNL